MAPGKSKADARASAVDNPSKSKADARASAVDNPSKSKNDAKTPAEDKKPARIKGMRKIKRKETFNIYIYKVLRYQNIGISSRAMSVMNSFINDIFERIATEAAILIKLSNKRTMNSDDIQSAVSLLMPGELRTHAMAEGVKALDMYRRSKSAD